MDWRGRKYYVARFSAGSYDMRMEMLRNIEGVSLHPPTKNDFRVKMPDETESRGYYQTLIGCRFDVHDIVEYELRKAERNDDGASGWKEIKRDTSKKYFDVCGFEMPYRRCDMNPNKKCNHCMNC